jgi:transcriptional regulator with XRE-family HTH domain
MSGELGAWLRQQREARGWARPEMARRLIRAGEARGDKSMPGLDSMCHNIYRWERGADGITERYKLHLCYALGIPVSRFGVDQPQEQLAAARPPGANALAIAPGLPAAPGLAEDLDALSGLTGPSLVLPVAVAYRGIQEPGMGDSPVQREVLMAAHEGSERAEGAEQRGIGDTTLEQFRADVLRLSREYMSAEPFPLFLEMRRVRGRMHDALDRRMWPRDATQLYFLLGCVNCLMANVASDLDNPQAAEELARAGWAYAVAIDHRPLMAQLRLTFTDIAYWHEQARKASELAQSGLQYLAAGPTAAQLHLKYARAAARTGESDAVHQAITAAHDARERDYTDDLLEIGGEFRLSWASHHSLAGSALIEIPGAERAAAAELEQATQLYQTGEPGEVFRYTLEARARIDLCTARLRVGALDAAVDAVEPVLSLPPSKRTLELPQRMSAVRAELAQPIFRDSVQVRDLDERIEDFGRESIITGLHSLPGTPG